MDARTLTKLLIKISNNETSSSSPFNIDRIEEAAFSVLSVFLFFKALSDAAYWLARTKLYQLIDSRAYGLQSLLSPSDFAGIVSTGLEFLLAVILFLGARGLVRLKNKVRGRAEE